MKIKVTHVPSEHWILVRTVDDPMAMLTNALRGIMESANKLGDLLIDPLDWWEL